MTLTIEVYNREKWIVAGKINPGDPPGSVSNNNPNGVRDLYIFECSPDNSKSVLYRSLGGADTETGLQRIISTEGTKIVKELTKNEQYEMTVRTDRSYQSQRIRFTHS